MKKFILFLVVMITAVGVKAGESDTVWVKDMSKFGENNVNDVRFSPDDKYAFVLCNKAMYMFNTETGEYLRKFKSSDKISSVDFFGDNERLITTSWDSLILVWNYKTGQKLDSNKGLKAYSCLRLFDNDTKIIMYYKDSIFKFSLDKYQNMQNISVPNTNSRELKISKDQIFLAVIKESVPANKKYWVNIYDALNFKLINIISHPNLITDIKFSNDSKYIASCGWQNSIIIYDLEKMQIKDTIHTDGQSDVYSIAFSPDSKNIIFGVPSKSNDYIYNLESRKIIYQYNIGNSRLETSNNSKYILSTTGRIARLLNSHWNPNSVPADNLLDETIFLSPNPTSGSSNIVINLPFPGSYSIKIFDESGKYIYLEKYINFELGRYILDWNLSSVTAGIYFCSVSSSSFEKTIKLIVSK